MTPNRAPASVWAHVFALIISVICRMRLARVCKFAACSGVSAKASHPLLKLCTIFCLPLLSVAYRVLASSRSCVCSCRPSFLLKRMEHIDHISESCEVEHARCARVVPYPKFLYALSNRGH